MIVGNIQKLTLDNTNFRKVIDTAKDLQLVLMSLSPKESIGAEVHPHLDQFIRIEQGYGMAVLNDVEYRLGNDDFVLVHAGVKHDIINLSNTRDLKLYTIYSRPNHTTNCLQVRKSDTEC